MGLVEAALALGEHGVVGLPLALGVIGHARGVENGNPEAVHRLLVGELGEDLAGPGEHRGAGDAPGVAAKIEAATVLGTLAVRGQRAGGGLGGVDAEHGVWVLAVNPQEGGTLAGERVHLLGLPARKLLEALEWAGVVLEARELVVAPDVGHVTSSGLVGNARDDAHELEALDGRGDNELLARLERNAA